MVKRAGEIPNFFQYRPSKPLNGDLDRANTKKIDLKASNRLQLGLLLFLECEITVLEI